MTDFGITSEMLNSPDAELLHEGRAANANVYKITSAEGIFVIKDFSKCPWWIRISYGRFMAGHEYRMLKALRGIDGVPQKIFRIGAYTIGMEFLEGKTISACLRDREVLPKSYFLALEILMNLVNARNIVHLDSRNAQNVMVLSDGRPALIDFQSGFSTRFLPGFLKRILYKTDLSGVYKHWNKNNPDTMDEARKKLLYEHFKLRQYWCFKGYKLFAKRRPKTQIEQGFLSDSSKKEDVSEGK